jgi:hypothetical protein
MRPLVIPSALAALAAGAALMAPARPMPQTRAVSPPPRIAAYVPVARPALDWSAVDRQQAAIGARPIDGLTMRHLRSHVIPHHSGPLAIWLEHAPTEAAWERQR